MGLRPPHPMSRMNALALRISLRLRAAEKWDRLVFIWPGKRYPFATGVSLVTVAVRFAGRALRANFEGLARRLAVSLAEGFRRVNFCYGLAQQIRQSKMKAPL